MNPDKNSTKPMPGKPEESPKPEESETHGYCAGYYAGYWTGMYDAIIWGSVALLLSCVIVTTIYKLR